MKEPGDATPWRLVGDHEDGTPFTVYAIQVWRPTFEHIDAWQETGWIPNDPRGSEDLQLENTVIFWTTDSDVAFETMPEGDWLKTEAHAIVPAESLDIEGGARATGRKE